MWNKIYVAFVVVMVAVIVVALANRAGVFELRKSSTESESDTPVSVSVNSNEDNDKNTLADGQTEFPVLSDTKDLLIYEIGEKAKCSFVPIEIRTDNPDEAAKRMKEFGFQVNSVEYREVINTIPDNLKGKITGINTEGLPEIDGHIFVVVNITITNDNYEHYTFWTNNVYLAKMSDMENDSSMMCFYGDLSNWYDRSYFGVQIPAKGEFTADFVYSVQSKLIESDIGLVIHPSGMDNNYEGAAIVRLGKIKKD